MKFLRPVAGYTPLDQKRNIDIRSELKTLDLTDSWYEHMLRMTTDSQTYY
jgi:hypothetical protein